MFAGDSPEDIQGARAATICPILIQRNKKEGKIIRDYNTETIYAEENHKNELFRDVKKISRLTDLIDLV